MSAEDGITGDTKIGIVLPARLIPDGSRVTKVAGTNKYTLKHTLILYQDPSIKDRQSSVKLQGAFLVGKHGDITQVDPRKRLVWWSIAGSLAYILNTTLGDDEMPEEETPFYALP